MRIIAQSNRYPKYIAEKREGRLKGQYPESISYLPHLKRQWDRGGFGTGTRLIEIEANSPSELIDKIRSQGYSPQHDDFEFFEIKMPMSPRIKIPIQKFFSMARS